MLLPLSYPPRIDEPIVRPQVGTDKVRDCKLGFGAQAPHKLILSYSLGKTPKDSTLCYCLQRELDETSLLVATWVHRSNR